MNTLTSNSPISEGFNAASAWIFSCIVFVFGALVGYTGILLKKKIILKRVSELFNQVNTETYYNALLS